MNPIKKNTLTLLLLFILFTAPGLGAYWLFMHSDWIPAAKTNKGLLLKKPRLISSFQTQHKWHLVFWNPAFCDTACMQTVDKLGRVRLALGRHLYEVESWLVINGEKNSLTADSSKLLRDQDVHVLVFPAARQASKQKFPAHAEVYLANPQGYLILAYSPTVNPKDIYHDLKRLLNLKES